MPKQSKVGRQVGRPPKNSRPSAALPIKERPEKYYCSRCVRSFKVQKGNFPATQSPLFKENGGYLTVCRHCVDELYDHYKMVLGNEKDAIKRICLKFDIYWNEKIYAMLNKSSTTNSRVLTYISKSNLYQFIGKTYDDTIDEMSMNGTPLQDVDMNSTDLGERIVPSCREDEYPISTEEVEFWGGGLSYQFYLELRRRLIYWCGGNIGSTPVNSMDSAELACIRQICMLEATINRDLADGKSIDKSTNALNNLLGSANLRPVQRKRDGDIEAKAESTPFGVWIRKIETTRPIKDVDPELNDVDGVIKYVSVWFLGHLCKMLKINNRYARLYEEEMERLRVSRPEYEGDDEDDIMDNIFSKPQREDGGDDP